MSSESAAEAVRTCVLDPMPRKPIPTSTLNGQRHYLWRAVDQDDHILDILVQRRRDKAAAKREIPPSVEHRQHR
jgi:hypothetical protein